MELPQSKKYKMENSKYGFTVGDLVECKVNLTSELGETYPKGSLIKIIAIAPKVTHTSKFRTENYPEYYDNKLFFFNAVAKGRENDRIRANFATVKKVK